MSGFIDRRWRGWWPVVRGRAGARGWCSDRDGGGDVDAGRRGRVHQRWLRLFEKVTRFALLGCLPVMSQVRDIW